MSINTNDLRIFADKLAIESDQQYLYAVASELDATRTERNLARSALTAAEARAEAAEASVRSLNELLNNVQSDLYDAYQEISTLKGATS